MMIAGSLKGCKKKLKGENSLFLAEKLMVMTKPQLVLQKCFLLLMT